MVEGTDCRMLHSAQYRLPYRVLYAIVWQELQGAAGRNGSRRIGKALLMEYHREVQGEGNSLLPSPFFVLSDGLVGLLLTL